MTFGAGFFIFICAFGIGYFTKRDELNAERAGNAELHAILNDDRDALIAERAECERLREIIYNSGAEKTPGSDVSGNLSRIQEPAHRWDCKKQGHQFVLVIQKNRQVAVCRRCNHSMLDESA